MKSALFGYELKHNFVGENGVQLVGKERTRAYLKWYHQQHAARLKIQKANAYQKRRSVPGFKEKERLEYLANHSVIRERQNTYLRKKRASGWKEDNTAKIRNNRERYNSDVGYKLRRRLSYATYRLVKKGWKRTHKTGQLIGCSWAELRAHIESLWLPGMNWDNHALRGWHIDHIRPLSSFDLTDANQIAAALHYTNLQPLWWRENILKKDHWASG